MAPPDTTPQAPDPSDRSAIDLAASAAKAADADRSWHVGDSVKLTKPLPYLKTADPMPMLRPADLVDLDDVGQVVGLRARNQLAVRFRRGTFLLDSTQLKSP